MKFEQYETLLQEAFPDLASFTWAPYYVSGYKSNQFPKLCDGIQAVVGQNPDNYYGATVSAVLTGRYFKRCAGDPPAPVVQIRSLHFFAEQAPRAIEIQAKAMEEARLPTAAEREELRRLSAENISIPATLAETYPYFTGEQIAAEAAKLQDIKC